MVKKILYGTGNFEAIIQGNGYYVDKTRFIREIEDLGAKYLIFLRPRRFGKSLFLSTLEHYYDMNRKDQFDELFGGLDIGREPTPLRNSFPILKLNFSGIATSGKIEDVERSFNLYVKSCIREFFRKYPDISGGETVFLSEISERCSAVDMLSLFVNTMATRDVKYYLLIDEYDNFANNILAEYGKDRYQSITHGVGFLRNFFAVIKKGTESRAIERMFATGVSPLVMSDVTSGFNMGDNISHDARFEQMAGFNESEVEQMTDYYIDNGLIQKDDRDKVLSVMRKTYNNYRFSEDSPVKLFNSNCVLYLIYQYSKSGKMPRDVIDVNMRTDFHKLRFLVVESRKLNGNFEILNEILQHNRFKAELATSFSVGDLIKKGKFVSLLFYLGFLSIREKSATRLVFEVPNDLCRELLWEYVREALKETFHLHLDQLADVYSLMVEKGEWEPLIRHIFEEFYAAAVNRDFIYREEGVKGFFLAYLNLSKAYRIHSEFELNKGYVDIYIEPNVQIYPDMNPTHFLLELKYISKKDVKTLAVKRLAEDATRQLDRYAKDHKLPPDTMKIAAVTTNEELVYLG